MGRKDEAFIRSLIDGRTLAEAAREAGLDEERAKSFLESVARFAGTVGSVNDFVATGGSDASGGSGTKNAPRFEDVVIYTDGASSGNPGPSGAGGVILTPDGETIEEFREHLGRATNNVAEYEAVRIGLDRAIRHGAKRVVVRLDSELVANQLTGRYRVKDTKLIERYLQVERLLSQLDEVRFESIPREQNARADKLAQAGVRLKK